MAKSKQESTSPAQIQLHPNTRTTFFFYKQPSQEPRPKKRENEDTRTEGQGYVPPGRAAAWTDSRLPRWPWRGGGEGLGGEMWRWEIFFPRRRIYEAR
jgi:hypothetical protein